MFPELNRTNPWVICKFGGSSVATATNWHNIHKIIVERLEQGLHPLLVCSALKGITNTLERMLANAADGRLWQQELHTIAERHEELAAEFGFTAARHIHQHMTALDAALEEVSRHGCTPAARARAMAQGELMSTRLGAAILRSLGLDASWRDARQMMTALPGSDDNDRKYLSARVSTDPDTELQARLNADSGIVITQGFIASSQQGETVLLGRGGSDTSAAYLAARLQAQRLEIWTDVPGMFSANPHQIEDARMIMSMDYEEAEALALAGGKVLHPRCIAPAREHNIPIHIKCTPRPEMNGTVISRLDKSNDPRLSAVSARNGLYWLNVDGLHSAQHMLPNFRLKMQERDLQVNMLVADGLSLQAAIDPLISPVSESELQDMMGRLDQVLHARVESDIHSLSLVGHGIDQVFDDLPYPLTNPKYCDVRHVGSNSNMDITLLMDEGAMMDEMISTIHNNYISSSAADHFGPTWQEVYREIRNAEPAVV